MLNPKKRDKMSAINFNFNKDPLLGQGLDLAGQFQELETAQKVLEQKKQALAQMIQQQPAAPQGTAPSGTPIWDEIDAITDSMTAAEFTAMAENTDYQKSLQALNEYVAAVQLQMLRPHIEKTEQGRKLLEQHLTNVKFLRKAAADNVEKQMADFADYTQNYSHLSWAEYLKTKGGKKK